MSGLNHKLNAYNENPSPALILDGVTFENAEGELEEPVDAVLFNVGNQNFNAQAESPSLSPQACTSEATHVFIKTVVDGSTVNAVKDARVRIYTESGVIYRFIGDDGRLEFPYSCGNVITLDMEAWTRTGMYMHTEGERQVIWRSKIDPTTGGITADSVRGYTVQMAPPSASYFSRASQRVFWRVNQAYNWERKASKRYETFPLDTFFPYSQDRGFAQHGRILLPYSYANYDAGIFHEFGHAVYYRRMMGGYYYNEAHQRIMNGADFEFPRCAGSILSRLMV